MAGEQPTKKQKLDDEEIKTSIKPLSHQVGGHGKDSKEKGFYECEDGSILKALYPEPDPRSPREVAFYQKVFNSDCTDSLLLQLRPLLPKYMAVTSIVPPGQEKSVKCLKLEDVASKYKKPCMIDIKMGRITYGPDATPEKIAKETSKYPPLKKIGFQPRGFRVYSPSRGEYDVYDKKYMNKLDEETVLTEGLQVFFSPDGKLCKEVVRTCLEKLQYISEWFETQTKFAFYASSLFIVYEGMPKRLTTAQDAKNGNKTVSEAEEPLSETKSTEDKNNSQDIKVDVRMIDFAHVFPSDGKDENYIYGLKSVTKYLTRLTED